MAGARTVSATEALKAARAAGVRIEVDSDGLSLEASAPPPPVVIDLLSRHKAEIVALLRPTQSFGEGRQYLQPDPFGKAYADLLSQCPDRVPEYRWRQAVEDGRAFLARWGESAAALGWTADDLFNLHEPPAELHLSYSRLSRYDCTGLIWLLQGLPVVALTTSTAAIENPTRSITVYRRFNKPGLGPLGDSLDDFK